MHINDALYPFSGMLVTTRHSYRSAEPIYHVCILIVMQSIAGNRSGVPSLSQRSVRKFQVILCILKTVTNHSPGHRIAV